MKVGLIFIVFIGRNGFKLWFIAISFTIEDMELLA